METLIWNFLISVVVAVMGTMLKGKIDEVKDLKDLLSNTRVDIARNYVPRIEFSAAIDKLTGKMDDGFEKLEKKIDKIIEIKFGEKD